MFATIRRHQSWLWVIVIVGVIVPFVWFMGPTQYNRGGSGGDSVYGYVGGDPVDREAFFQAQREVRLSHYLSTREWPEADEANSRVPERLFLIWKQRQLGIRVGDDAVADWIATVFRDRETGTFRTSDYEELLRQLRSVGFTKQTFNEYARHEVGTRHLAALGALSGSLLPPREVEALFRRQNEEVTAEIAFFSISNRLAEVLIEDDAVAAYYTNNAARYRVPERVQVSYVRFANSNFVTEATAHLEGMTNLTLQLDQIYQQRGANAFRGTNGEPLDAVSAKAMIREEYLQGLSGMFARKRAMEFAEQLYNLTETEPGRAELLNQLAASNQLQVAVTEPFTRFARPLGLDVNQEFATAAFALTPAQPIAINPITGPDATFIIALKERLEGYLPPLQDRRPTVEANYRRENALKAAHAAAEAFALTLTNGYAQNLSFATVCSNANLTPIRTPAFSRSTQSLPALAGRLDLNQLKSVALDLATGGTSGVETTSDGAMIVHVLARQPVDEAKLKSELPAFIQSLREEQRQTAMIEWFQREIELANVNLPVLQSQRGTDQTP